MFYSFKIIFLLISCLLGGILSFSQANTEVDNRIELISDINGSLSNAWTISIKVNDSDQPGYKANAIKAYLFTYKTKVNGRNSGVTLNFYDIAFKDSVLSDKAAKHSDVDVTFYYTKNYIVYLNNGKGFSDLYDQYIEIFKQELALFFEQNGEAL